MLLNNYITVIFPISSEQAKNLTKYFPSFLVSKCIQSEQAPPKVINCITWQRE